MELVIKNTGNADLTIYDIYKYGGSNDFKIQSSRYFKISPNSYKTIKFLFKPSSTGHKEATFVIKSNDPNNPTVKIYLSGEGIDQVNKIEVLPKYWNPKVGEISQFKAKAYYKSGKSKDVTKDVDWRSSNSKIIVSLGDGKFKAVSPGTAKIIAKYNGKIYGIDVNVKNNNNPVNNLLEKYKIRGKIRKESVVNAFDDWLSGKISKNDMVKIFDAWLGI